MKKKQRAGAIRMLSLATGLPNGRVAYLGVPADMTGKDFEFLRRFIDLIEEGSLWFEDEAQRETAQRAPRGADGEAGE